jgi:nitroimidazol reductase NimA-like FMN-containing flavoprotein (pyridoxamine 5'-phosphate oxidase superfamily)
MPRDYSKSPTAYQRISKYKREDDWIRTFLREAQICRIGTSWDGQPFVMANTFWFDEGNHRIIFHTNRGGRTRVNIERNPWVCLEVSDLGRLLPSNVALEFSLQYRSVMVFGTARLLDDTEEQRAALYGLIGKYFDMTAGEEYRPITDQELRQTSVYALDIESWSGKENWKDRASQSDEWPALDKKWFE